MGQSCCNKTDVNQVTIYLQLRSNRPSPIDDIFKQIYKAIQDLAKKNPIRLDDANWLKKMWILAGEHSWVTFATAHGRNSIENLILLCVQQLDGHVTWSSQVILI